MRWTEKQLKEFWDKKTQEEKKKYRNYEEWKKSIIQECD